MACKISPVQSEADNDEDGRCHEPVDQKVLKVGPVVLHRVAVTPQLDRIADKILPKGAGVDIGCQ